jgi:hypothetical protein
MNPIRIIAQVGRAVLCAPQTGRPVSTTLRRAEDCAPCLGRLTAALLAAAILGLGNPAPAQEPDAGQTNDVSEAEVLSRLGELIQQAVGSGQGEDMTPPNNGASTAGGAPQPGTQPTGVDRSNRFSRSDNSKRPDSSSRSDNSSRSKSKRSRSGKPDQSRSSGPTRDYSGGSDRSDSPAGTNAGPGSLDYAAFKIIVDRNIFDPNRFPRSAPRGPTRPATHVDSLTLVGTMSYDKGTFAFFDGTSSDYKKALKQTDVIVGYKVSNITPSSVTLAAGTNEMKLGVGMQLRREEDGPWRLSGQSGSYAAIAGSTSTSTNAAGATSPDSTSGAAESDIIKRLMQKRQQE